MTTSWDELFKPRREALPDDGPLTMPTERLEVYAKAAADGEVARLDAMRAAATPGGAGYQGEPWDATTYEVACTLLELANASWNTLSPAEAVSLVREHAPTDAGFDDRQVEAKITSARATVGLKARPAPQDREGGAVPEVTVLDAPATTLDDAHKTFLRWLGQDYDTDALDVVLATAAVERLDGDPLWLLLLSGSGNAKTETVQALTGAGATVTSTVSSEAALLSGSPKKERAKDATGGLLPKLGARGVLVIKDVTSVLSMNRDARAAVLAALREVYDGRWERNVGTDGGRTLTWTGRLAVIGAVTTAWDRAHAVVAAMGDRFVIVRTDSTTSAGRIAAGRQAISNTGAEVQMRADLAAAAGGVIAGMNHEAATVTQEETERLLAAADIVTRARTGVDRDYRGDVIDAHAPEAPTRFAKQLAQVVRGAVALGIGRADALRLAIRCARDSMPPLRLLILDDVAANPRATASEVRKRVGKPRATVDRELQALHMLEVLTCEEEPFTMPNGSKGTRWMYRLADGIDPAVIALIPVPEMSSHTRRREEKVPPDKSGTGPGALCTRCRGPLDEASQIIGSAICGDCTGAAS